MNRSKNKLALIIIHMLMFSVTFAQVNEALKYFPRATGNTWRSVSSINGQIYDSKITKDSTDTNGSTFIFYDNALSPKYRVDTTGSVYQFVGTSTVLWFKLAAQHGDSFYTWNDTYKVKVTVNNQTIFGIPILTKIFTWFLNPPGTYMYARQSLAKNFGMIRTYAELGPVDSYVTGCIIDSIRYGTLVSVPDMHTNAPFVFALQQNYPNPFNPSTRIEFTMTTAEHVRLSIYNVLGREIYVLIDEYKPAGSHYIYFNGTNLASGIYFYKLSAGRFTQSKRMAIIK